MNVTPNIEVSSDTARQQTDSNSDTTVVTSPNHNTQPASEAANITNQTNTSTVRNKKLTLPLTRLADYNSCSNAERTATYSSRRRSRTLDAQRQEYEGAKLSVESDLAEFISCRYDQLASDSWTEQIQTEIQNRLRLIQGGFEYTLETSEQLVAIMKSQALVADSQNVQTQIGQLRLRVEEIQATYGNLRRSQSPFHDETLRLGNLTAQDQRQHTKQNTINEVEHGTTLATIHDAPIPSRHSTPDVEHSKSWESPLRHEHMSTKP